MWPEIDVCADLLYCEYVIAFMYIQRLARFDQPVVSLRMGVVATLSHSFEPQAPRQCIAQLSHTHTHPHRTNQSLFRPTVPIFLSPQTLVKRLTALTANKNQKAALYPFINACGVSLSLISDVAVTSFAISVASANPTLLPTCEIVLKTPPASPCVFFENEAEIRRFETVKSPSAPMGLKRRAGKAQAQYDHLGFTSAISTGETHDMIVETMTMTSARTR